MGCGVVQASGARADTGSPFSTSQALRVGAGGAEGSHEPRRVEKNHGGGARRCSVCQQRRALSARGHVARCALRPRTSSSHVSAYIS